MWYRVATFGAWPDSAGSQIAQPNKDLGAEGVLGCRAGGAPDSTYYEARAIDSEFASVEELIGLTSL